MDTAGERSRQPNRSPRLLITVVVAITVVGFGLITAIAPDRNPIDADQIDAAALVEPEIEAGFRAIAALDEGPWESFRIAGAYLFMGGGPTVITDDDLVLEVELPEMEVLFGAIDAGGESIAFGRTARGPAIWRSPDAVSWSLERLGWDGTVRAAAEIDGRLVLIGIEQEGPSFHFVTATEAPGGWLVIETNRVPDTGLISVPGGFVGRGTATDGSGYGYLYSDDGLDWTFRSSRSAAGSRSAGQIPAFVIETGGSPLLRLPGDDRVFAPPAWPLSGLWIEGEVVWAQTPDSAWSTLDGKDWREYPIDSSTGVGSGYSVLLPVGDTARLVTSSGDRISLARWDPGSERDG